MCNRRLHLVPLQDIILSKYLLTYYFVRIPRLPHPDERAGDIFNTTIYGYEQQPELTLDDCLVLDEQNRPKRQTRRGVSYPVHKLPPGIGFIDKVRAQQEWNIACWTTPATVAHMIAILSLRKQCYLYVDEVKTGRFRAVRAIDLQTEKPE